MRINTCSFSVITIGEATWSTCGSLNQGGRDIKEIHLQQVNFPDFELPGF